MQTNVPVLFLIFNRLDTTEKVFQRIRDAKPKKLYIACDGARENREGEKERVQEIRDYVLSNIDWDCEVKTLFRDKNLGCKYAVSGAITWFFENEEMGIILEDDCFPSLSFFKFCEECLEKYKNEEKVMQINGTSFISELEKLELSESYFFSKYNHIWGWASWRRAWKKYEIENSNFEKTFEETGEVFNSDSEKKYWYKILKNYFDGNVDTWDYPWTFSVWKNRGVSIYPKFNMIRNIGMGHIEATHTTSENEDISNMEIHEVENIIHPKTIDINRELDLKNYEMVFKPLDLGARIVRKLKKILKIEKKSKKIQGGVMI